MLRVVVGLAGDGHHDEPARQPRGVLYRGLHIRDVLQHLQQRHHVEGGVRRVPVAYAGVQRGQVFHAAVADRVEQAHPTVKDVQTGDRYPWKLAHERKQEHAPAAAHVQQTLRLDAPQKAHHRLDPGQHLVPLEIVELQVRVPPHVHQVNAVLLRQALQRRFAQFRLPLLHGAAHIRRHHL